VLKVEELENVGFGCTGPRDWRRAWRPGLGLLVWSRFGSGASDWIAVEREALLVFLDRWMRVGC
jgi:hypothetical protein